MRRRLVSLILILCLLMMAVPFVSAADHPIRLTAEPDPDTSLTGPGTLDYVRFVIRNTGDEEYILYDPMLSSKILDEPFSLHPEDGEAGTVVMAPGGAREFTLTDLYLPENALNKDVKFTLTWQEAVSYTEEYEPEEEEDDMPEPDEEYEEEEEEEEEEVFEERTAVRYEERSISTTICIETAEDPVMSLSVKADSTLVRTDGEVNVKYVLSNPTKFDFEDITLKDNGAGGEIELEETTLRAGETMTVPFTFIMGRENAVLSPQAVYTVRGKTTKTKAAKSVTVEYMYDSLTLDVQPYSATEAGTMFGLTVTNAGTHRMREIELRDDSGTRLCEPFSLGPGQSRSITYTYGSYTGLKENRRVSFVMQATDSEGETYMYQKPGSFEIRPFVGSGQVSLLMNVTLADYHEEKNTVEMLFEIRNYSDVAISNAVISETEVLHGAVREYPQLSKGVTTFTREFALGEGISLLTFHMEADDAGGTHYVTEPVSLAVDRLALTVKNGTFGSASNAVINTTNTVFDTDKYASYISTGLAALLIAATVFVLISFLFRGAESYIRKTLPAPKAAPKITAAGESVQDTARMRFGYMKPAKLRYLEEERPLKEEKETSEEQRSTSRTGAVKKTAPKVNYPGLNSRSVSPAGSVRRPQPGAVKVVSTGTFKKPGRQVKMLTTADTLVFGTPGDGKKKTPAVKKETGAIPAAGNTMSIPPVRSTTGRIPSRDTARNTLSVPAVKRDTGVIPSARNVLSAASTREPVSDTARTLILPSARDTARNTGRTVIVPAARKAENVSEVPAAKEREAETVRFTPFSPVPEQAVKAAPEQKKKAPEKRLTMCECLAAGKPYTFEITPLPAVRPAEAEKEIVFIAPPSLPA